MHIIDGQHRLEAAKKLGFPIFYEVQQDLKHEDMFILNKNQKNWGAKDYINYYCEQNYPEYVKLASFAREKKLSILNK